MSYKAKPTELKLLEGNRGHRKIRDNPKPEKPYEFPKAPDWLDEIGKEEWNDKGNRLFKLGMLTTVDLALFAGQCDNWSKYRKATERLDRMTYFKEYRMCCELFGMSPSSRSKLEVKKPIDKPSKMESLINRN